jgi:hypothetical protein
VRAISTLIVAIGVGVLALAAPAWSEVTLGSKLENSYETTFGGTSGITVYQQVAPEETLTAPSAGMITAWSVRSGDEKAKYELRVLHASGGEFTASGTSSPQTVPDSEDEIRGPFPVSLPVSQGDRIALDVIGGAGAPINNTLAPLADALNYMGDPFSDGTTKKPVLSMLGNSQELLLQASFVPAPVDTALPSISGEARAGETLLASDGSWENATSFAFQWTRCAGALCSAIPGATSPSYMPSTADEGLQLRVDVTATGEGGKATASSELTPGIKPGPSLPPGNAKLPELSGEARETEQLSGTQGNWTGTPTVFQYQWLRCASATGGECVGVSGATSSTYTLTHQDVGSTMRLQVTAVNAVGPTSADSPPSAIVQPLVIRARLSIHPDGSCTGIQTAIDASGSQTPNPPLHYQFTYSPYPNYLEAIYGGGWEEHIYENASDSSVEEGSNPTPVQIFTWNRRVGLLDVRYAPYEEEGEFIRDPILVTLKVTDGAGATATTREILYFADLVPNFDVARCPKPPSFIVAPNKIFSFKPAASVVRTSVLSQIRCVTAAPCAGSISIVSSHALIAAKKTRKVLTYASKPFFSLAGHHSALLRVKLTATGRAWFKHHRTLKALETVKSVTPAGSAATRSIRVTLRRK